MIASLTLLQVGYIICDNAKNNGTMLAHFAQCMEEATGMLYDEIDQYVQSLPHIINLATQAVLDAYSKTPHYDPHALDIELVNQHGARRDVIGLVWCISVKMVDQFVYEIGSHEKDRKGRQKLLNLQLSEDEWDRVKICLDLLGHADKAQQAFSAKDGPTLHHGLPALEALHKSWTARLDKPKYAEFCTAICAGLDKVEEYYKKTADSDVYTFAMSHHLDKFWGKELHQETVDHAKKIYKKCYYELATKADGPMADQRASASSAALQREQQCARWRVLSDDEDSDAGSDSHASAATTLGGRSQPDPWCQDFYGYLNSPDNLRGKTIVQWWGHDRSMQAGTPYGHPLLKSQDFLSVIVSSVLLGTCHTTEVQHGGKGLQ
ncbi:hypothetical protein VTO73DRAFT_10093 [Trametes versicolor]